MIIGLTGTIGSGKSEISRYLKTCGFSYVTISDLIREELRKRNLPLKREELQNLGNELRKLHGNNYWAKKAIETIGLNKDGVIDGIRNIGEIEELRNLPNSFIIGIDAPENIRLMRAKRRKRIIEGRLSSDSRSENEFKRIELRDRGLDEPSHGQQVLKCIEMADYVIINDSSLKALQENISSIVEKLKKSPYH